MKIKNFENIKDVWNTVVQFSTLSNGNKWNFTLTDAYTVFAPKYNTLVYRIVLNSRWQVDLLYVDTQWYLDIKANYGVQVQLIAIELDIVKNKRNFACTVIDRLSDIWSI